MSLHAGENFDKSEYGLHTSYGDYEYFYDYLGDGDFEVLAMKPIKGTKASETIKDLNNAEKRRPENVSRNGDVWEANRERFIGTGSPDGTRGNSLSNDGLDSGLLENDKNNRPEEDGEKSNRTSEADTYFKTGADGTNRPRYEKRYSLKKAPIFFSNTLDAISTTKKLPAKQKVRSWLKTLPPFVEKDEDKWMGLTEWLKGKDPEESLTKEDILDYVRTHDVEMVEVNYSKDGHRNVGENPDYFDVEYRKIVDFATSSTTDFIRSEVGVSLDLTAVDDDFGPIDEGNSPKIIINNYGKLSQEDIEKLIDFARDYLPPQEDKSDHDYISDFVDYQYNAEEDFIRDNWDDGGMSRFFSEKEEEGIDLNETFAINSDRLKYTTHGLNV